MQHPMVISPFSRQFGLLAFLSAFSMLPAWAGSELPSPFAEDKLRISGFATIGAVKAGNEILGFQRNVSQNGQYDSNWAWETDSLLGLQLDAKLSPNWAGAIQVVARDRVSDDIEDSIEWAYIGYQFNPSWRARAGRIGLDIFMLSEYRNLGFAYLWARPPVEFYGSIAFDHYDGFDITYSIPINNGNLDFRFFGGRSDSTFGYKGREVKFVLEPAFGISATWENEHWRAKLSIADLKFGDEMSDEFGTQSLIKNIEALPTQFVEWPEANDIIDDLDVDGKGILYNAIGLAYDNTPWNIQAEASYISSDYEMYQSFINYYLSIGYRLGPTTLYVMGASSENKKDRDLIPAGDIILPDPGAPLPADVIAALTAGALAVAPALDILQQVIQDNYDSAKIDQRTLTIGMRWDIRYDLALKFQIDRTKVEAFRSALWSPKEELTEDDTLNTYTINLNYVFR